MLNLIDDDLFFTISDAILEKDFNVVFQTTEKIYQNGWDFIDFNDGLLEHFRNILTVILTDRTELVETADVYRTKYANYIQTFSKGDLLRILNYLSKLQQELRYSNNQKLKIEIALTNLVGLEKSATLSEIISGLESGNIEIKTSDTNSITKEKSPTSYSAKQIVPEKKREIKAELTPKTEAFVPPIKETLSGIQSDLNFEMITQKWQSFVDDVCKEKSFLLTPLFNKIKPINFDGTNLHLESSDPATESSLRLHQEYIDKKSRDFFGKKVNIKFGADELPKTKSTTSKETKFTKSAKTSKILDPYEKIIIEDLGGQEIN
jgi:DNA polymerase-3 subunit gamma/tau